MSSRTSATAIAAFGVVLAAVSASPAFAQTAENVMVVINEASPESVRIGEYYIAKRNIPPENVTRLKTAVADEMDRAAYEFFIERPDLANPHAARDAGPHSLHRPDEGHSPARARHGAGSKAALPASIQS